MKVSISGKQLDRDERLRTQITNRPEFRLSMYFGGSMEPHVAISSEGQDYWTHCLVHVDSQIVVQSHGNADEPRTIFDEVVEKLENNSAVRSGSSALSNTVDSSARGMEAPRDLVWHLANC